MKQIDSDPNGAVFRCGDRAALQLASVLRCGDGTVCDAGSDWGVRSARCIQTGNELLNRQNKLLRPAGKFWFNSPYEYLKEKCDGCDQ